MPRKRRRADAWRPFASYTDAVQRRIIELLMNILPNAPFSVISAESLTDGPTNSIWNNFQ